MTQEFTPDQLLEWLEEAKELEEYYRKNLIQWKRVRENLEARLNLVIDQQLAVMEVEKWLDQ